MQSILWAFSSVAILTLIIYLLPLGYTLKGKLLLVLISFILSLAGLAAVSIIPLWETALILLALSFFAAYFMGNRLGTVLLPKNPLLEEPMDVEIDGHNADYKIENLKDINLVEIGDELPIADSSHFKLEKDPVTEVVSSQDLSEIVDVPVSEQEPIDMDISFLLERENEVDVMTQIEDQNMENDYLSDIESLLELESRTEQMDSQEDPLELSPIRGETTLAAELGAVEQELSDDSLFDFLLAKKEAAADREDVLDVIESKEKVVLQK
ncbi:SoxR reducing system RseC family protein [Neobacillus sp. KR4-4]|uniref:SoxR reducing system RseC family protein n=1 Tax=Neobacillus sp. KR4-4 TaxID=3344872 RepID=UPI0035CA8E7B